MAGVSSPVTTSTTNSPSTWVIVGASRGIGLEFVRQLLARGDQVIAAVRDPGTASQLWQLAADGGPQTGLRRPGSCVIEKCDVTSEEDISVSHAWLGRELLSRWCMSWGRFSADMYLSTGFCRQLKGSFGERHAGRQRRAERWGPQVSKSGDRVVSLFLYWLLLTISSPSSFLGISMLKRRALPQIL